MLHMTKKWVISFVGFERLCTEGRFGHNVINHNCCEINLFKDYILDICVMYTFDNELWVTV